MVIGEIREMYILKRTEIIIYIANDEEKAAMESFLKGNNIVPIQITKNNRIINLFKFMNYHFALLYSENIGPINANNMLNMIKPFFPNVQYIVNLGCCACAEKQLKNKTIIANCIFDADLRKEEKKLTKYRIGVQKNDFITNIIKNSSNILMSYKKNIIVGGLISSSAVVKGQETKEKYLKAYPYADGIEMEGLAISNFAIENNINWIIIKGTSDNGVIKNGGEGQFIASLRAINIFFLLIRHSKLPLKRVPVFIGGSFSDSLIENENNCKSLGKALLENNFKIINGLGLGVGTALIASVYEYKANTSSGFFTDYMEIFPFPRVHCTADKPLINDFYYSNRSHMAELSTIAIFIYGECKKGKTGTEEEFNLCGSKNIVRLVIPDDKYMSKNLFDVSAKLLENIINCKIKKQYLELNKLDDFNKKIKKLISILKSIDTYFYLP